MLLIALTGGCVGQHNPTSYCASVRKDFVQGCADGYVGKDGGKDPNAQEHRQFCGCLYDQMSNKKSGIPFSEFSSAQSKIRQNPSDPANTLTKLIPRFDAFVKTCTGKVQAGPTGTATN